MDKILKKAGIRNVVVYGIATDYCVKATAIDAAAAGSAVIMVENSEQRRGAGDLSKGA